MEKNSNKHITNRPILTKKPPRRKSVDLSFNKRESFGEWIINHALSIAVVIAFFVTLGISMLFLNYSVEKSSPLIIIEVDTGIEEEVPTPEQIEELRKEKERLEQEIQQKLVQDIKNRQSNEAQTEEGGSESQVFDEEMNEMINHIEGVLHDSQVRGGSPTPSTTVGDGGEGSGSGGGKGDGKDRNFSGRVTVEYKFDNPVRSAKGQLYAPAYRAEHSGVVVVEVALNRNGDVLYSSVRIKQSSGKQSLDDEALAAARHKSTRFNIDGSAPERHVGTITYTFIAQ